MKHSIIIITSILLIVLLSSCAPVVTATENPKVDFVYVHDGAEPKIPSGATRILIEQTEKISQAEPTPAEEEIYYEEYYEEPYIQTGEYDPDFGEHGPTHTMPGWYEGNIETYYSSNVLHHYRTDEGTPDEEGFYRDDQGRYVVGVGVNDVNPETGETYQIGDTVQTGKGEGVVSDYGNGANVHDFYTNW